MRGVEAFWTFTSVQSMGVIVGGTLSRRIAAPVAIVLLALASACGPRSSTGGGPSSVPSLATPSAIPSSSDPAAIRQSVLDAYRGMWQAYQRAIQVPDPNSADLARYATGDALETLRKGLQSLKDQGLKGTGDVTLSPQVTAFSLATTPPEFQLSDCMDSSGTRVVRATPGPAYSDSPGGHRRVLATVQRQADGSWKVSSFAVQAVGSCG